MNFCLILTGVFAVLLFMLIVVLALMRLYLPGDAFQKVIAFLFWTRIGSPLYRVSGKITKKIMGVK